MPTSRHSTVSSGESPDALPLAFKRGWMYSPASASPPIPPQWTAVTLGQSVLTLHPATRWVRTESEHWSVALIGYPIDTKLATKANTLICERLSSLLGADHPSSEALRYIAYLGGRFVAILNHKRSNYTWLVPDATASMPVFWGRRGATPPLFASHSKLVANCLKFPPDENSALLLRSAKQLKTPGTLYLPGTLTHWTGVSQLLANHYLAFANQDVTHERFYPFRNTSLTRDTRTAYAEFVENFERHVHLICQLGTPAISLTAGRDSRSTLVAASPYLAPKALTWTFYKSTSHHQGIEDDMNGAQALARQFELNHIKVDVAQEPDAQFEAALTETMGHGHQMRRLPEAYHRQLPADIIELNSMVAETGTGFYRRRTEHDITAERLAYLYSRSPFGRTEAVVNAYADFIDYAEFYPERLEPIDYHDLFYWENRIGRWGSQRIQEVDMAHLVMLPFNSRRIIEALLGPELSERIDKQALSRYIETMQ